MMQMRVRAERLAPDGSTTWTRLMISNQRLCGYGTFGNVYSAQLQQPEDRKVAIKKTWPESGSHVDNREIATLRYLNHPNIVRLLYFFSNVSTDQQTVVNLVFEFLPTSVLDEEMKYYSAQCIVPLYESKLWTYQLFLAISYLHSKSICHLDIKPTNILLNPETGVVKLADLGSAKVIKANDKNETYQVTRYYRAPEMLIGYQFFGLQIDLWAAACCFGKFLKGAVLFPGDDTADQLQQIMKVLGTPTSEQVWTMYPDHPDPVFYPVYQAKSWKRVLNKDVPDSAIDLISRLLVYDPKQRLSALEVCQHDYFGEVRNADGQPVILTEEERKEKLGIKRRQSLHRSMSDIDLKAVAQQPLRGYSR